MGTIFESGRIGGTGPSGIAALAGAFVLPSRAARLIRRWAARGRQRRHLARLDDHLLRDIGLSRRDAWREIDKPFWRG